MKLLFNLVFFSMLSIHLFNAEELFADINQQPSLNITFSNKILHKGEQLIISWKADNVPDETSIGLFLTPNVSPNQHFKHTNGPLTTKTIPINKTLQGQYKWDTSLIAWAPNDAPALRSSNIDLAEYYIEAIVYE